MFVWHKELLDITQYTMNFTYRTETVYQTNKRPVFCLTAFRRGYDWYIFLIFTRMFFLFFSEMLTMQDSNALQTTYVNHPLDQVCPKPGLLKDWLDWRVAIIISYHCLIILLILHYLIYETFLCYLPLFF